MTYRLEAEPLQANLTRIDAGSDQDNLRSEYLKLAAGSKPQETALKSAKAIDVIIKADPTKLTPAMRSIQGLAENFQKAEDKTAALGQFRGAFEKTVQQTDSTFAGVLSQYQRTMAEIGPTLELKMQKLEAAQTKVNTIAENIPAADKPRIQKAGELWLLSEKSPALRQAIEKEMSQYPGLVPAFKEADKAAREAEPYMSQIAKLEKAGEAAIEDRVYSRMVFADALEAGGDNETAKKMRMEGLVIQMSADQPDLEGELEKQLQKQ